MSTDKCPECRTPGKGSHKAWCSQKYPRPPKRGEQAPPDPRKQNWVKRPDDGRKRPS